MCINGEVYMCKEAVENTRQPSTVININIGSASGEDLEQIEERIKQILANLFRDLM
jgi:hypothetical protein